MALAPAKPVIRSISPVIGETDEMLPACGLATQTKSPPGCHETCVWNPPRASVRALAPVAASTKTTEPPAVTAIVAPSGENSASWAPARETIRSTRRRRRSTITSWVSSGRVKTAFPPSALTWTFGEKSVGEPVGLPLLREGEGVERDEVPSVRHDEHAVTLRV